jgi:hypothetical protein
MRHALVVLAGLAAVGCGMARVPSRSAHRHLAPPPTTEFLLGAGDSTFWVRTGRDGVHVRGAPLMLARYNDRFYEIYVADDDRSYTNAVFVGQRIYRRDLVNGDSVAVFEDTTVGKAAARYAARHPDDTPLLPDEDAADDPASSVTGEVDVLDLDGPFLSYQYHGALNGEAGSGETVRHGVLDLRAGPAPKSAAALKVVLGAPASDRVLALGRRRFGVLRDSVRSFMASEDEGERRGAHALSGGAFAFDPASFTLGDRDRSLTVTFIVPGHGATGNGRYLALDPIPVASALPPWWRDVRATLPTGDSTTVIWKHGPVDIVARYDTVDDDIQVALRDSAKHEWSVAHVPSPAHRVFFLDGSNADNVTRKALLRAFDESALYSDDARSVRYDRPRYRVAPRRSPRASSPHSTPKLRARRAPKAPKKSGHSARSGR